jgi:hypothetical protein
MQSHSICDDSLHHRNDRASHDGHVQQTRSGARKWAELRLSQAEDGGKHDRIEEPDRQYRPHGDMPGQQHGGGNQRASYHCADGQQRSRLETLQQRRADEAADHRAAPVEGNKSGSRLGREIGDLGQTEIVD